MQERAMRGRRGVLPLVLAVIVTLVAGGSATALAATPDPLDAHTDLEFSLDGTTWTDEPAPVLGEWGCEPAGTAAPGAATGEPDPCRMYPGDEISRSYYVRNSTSSGRTGHFAVGVGGYEISRHGVFDARSIVSPVGAGAVVSGTGHVRGPGLDDAGQSIPRDSALAGVDIAPGGVVHIVDSVLVPQDAPNEAQAQRFSPRMWISFTGDGGGDGIGGCTWAGAILGSIGGSLGSGGSSGSGSGSLAGFGSALGSSGGSGAAAGSGAGGGAETGSIPADGIGLGGGSGSAVGSVVCGIGFPGSLGSLGPIILGGLVAGVAAFAIGIALGIVIANDPEIRAAVDDLGATVREHGFVDGVAAQRAQAHAQAIATPGHQWVNENAEVRNVADTSAVVETVLWTVAAIAAFAVIYLMVVAARRRRAERDAAAVDLAPPRPDSTLPAN